ncbi:hypothetical protein TNCV_3771621 [Trichonephila clavipes]|nr:hypothetical protein TNCV_3771621 [Trichonephila clavipes]
MSNPHQVSCETEGSSATKTLQILTEDYGDETLSHEHVFEWHKRFLGEKDNVEDDERAGRPRDLELKVNEDDIEDLIMGQEDELIAELQEILNEERQETQQNVSPEQEDDESGLMPTHICH